jgi:diguanylate cyclase (GGDEF)-like protein
MFLDLDRFKIINDSLGHPIGDALMIAVAQRLRSGLRAADVVARMGGDEFTFLLESVDDESTATRIAQKIIDLMQSPFVICGQELHVTASIGVSLYPEHGETPEQLLKHADVALHQAKAKGKNQLCLFAPAMKTDSRRQMLLETHLRHALDRNEFHVVYQPQINLASGRLVGVEALVRWDHPRLGAMPPDRFISIAEETGLICPLGSFVLKTACEQLQAWSLGGRQRLRLAVNLSPRQIQDPRLCATVAAVLEATQIDPALLEFEITENAFIDEGEVAARQIAPLTAMGVGLVLDDFGTGYSSLSRLKRYPIRRIKIDRTFVSDIGRNQSDTALVKATVAIADCLGIGVIAEGIETSDQLSFLRDCGCAEGQGFLIARPTDATQIARLLSARRPNFTAVFRRQLQRTIN